MTSPRPGGAPEGVTPVNTGQRISLLDWKAQNIRNSFLLAAFMFVLLAGIAYLLALAFDPAAAAAYVLLAVLVAGSQNAIAYWFSDRIALAATGAREATREEHRYLVNVTEAVAIGAGVPVPKIWVIDSPAPNAFATGRNPDHAAVAVTTGLLQLLDRQELEGVMAHELAHVRNYDILFGSMLVATVGAIILLRDLILRGMRFGGGRGRRDSNGGGRGGGQAQALGYLLLVVLLVLAPVLAMLLHLAISRKREFLADASGAYITRNPEGLARALEKLRDYAAEPLKVSDSVRHMFFVNPVKQFNASTLGATHPPIEERIRRLRQM